MNDSKPAFFDCPKYDFRTSQTIIDIETHDFDCPGCGKTSLSQFIPVATGGSDDHDADMTPVELHEELTRHEFTLVDFMHSADKPTPSNGLYKVQEVLEWFGY